MLDKIASWRGELQLRCDVLFAPNAEAALDARDLRGESLPASHLSDVEVCRVLAKIQGCKTINMLVFSEDAQRFGQIVRETAPQVGINLTPITDIGPETVIPLKEKLDNDEWVTIVGDRITIDP